MSLTSDVFEAGIRLGGVIVAALGVGRAGGCGWAPGQG